MTKSIISVSKKHDSIWRIYFFDDDGFKSERISRLLVPFYKLMKLHKEHMTCLECGYSFYQLFNWFTRKKNECPECYFANDDVVESS